jgi:hypothetical protein
MPGRKIFQTSFQISHLKCCSRYWQALLPILELIPMCFTTYSLVQTKWAKLTLSLTGEFVVSSL